MAKRFVYQSRDAADWHKRASGARGEGYLPGEFNVYQVRKGDNYVRLLPPTWPEARHYGLDVWVHYGVGPDRRTVLCTKRMVNKPCPICEAWADADRSGDDVAKKELAPKRRVLVWMIDRKDEDKGAQLWPMPQTLDSNISKAAEDPDTGEIYEVDNPERGYNVSFTTEGEREQRKYTGVNLARKASSIAPEYLDLISDNPLPDLLQYLSYDEMLELYEGPPDENAGAPRRDRDSSRDMPRGSERELRRDEPSADDDRAAGRYSRRAVAAPEPEPDDGPPPRRTAGGGQQRRREPEPEEYRQPPRESNGQGYNNEPPLGRFADAEPPPRRRAVESDPQPDDDPPPRTARTRVEQTTRGAPEPPDDDPRPWPRSRTAVKPDPQPDDDSPPRARSRADELREQYSARRAGR